MDNMDQKNQTGRGSRIHMAGFIIFTIFLVLLHGQWNLDTNDDLWYQVQLTQHTLGSYLNWRYHTWTSRVLIEAVLFSVVRMNVWLWRCVDITAMIVIAEGTGFLALDKDQQAQRIVSYLFFCIIPLQIYAEAGYGATTVNYIWPMACCITVFCVIKQDLCAHRVPITAYLTAGAAAVFAANQEQLAAVMLGMTSVLLVYKIWHRNRKRIVFLLYVFLISLLSIFNFLFCPGNAARTVTEMNVYPQYMDYSFFDKLRIGLISEGLYFFCGFGKNLILFTLVFALIYRGIKSGKKLLVILQLPCLFSLCGGILAKLWGRYSGTQEALYMENVTSNEGLTSTLLCLLVLILWINLFISVSISDLSIKKKLFLLLIILAGIMARLVLCLSPSIFNSGFRTTLCSSFCFMTAAIIVIFDQTQNAAVKSVQT